MDEARSAVKAGLALNPDFTLSRARATYTAMSDDPTYLAQLEFFFRRPAQGRSLGTMRGREVGEYRLVSMRLVNLVSRSTSVERCGPQEPGSEGAMVAATDEPGAG